MALPHGRTALRTLRADDHAPVQALFARHGWPVRSRHGWDWALMHNPARAATGAAAGWVLESGRRIVGFLGNLPQAYRLDGQAVSAATCTSYLVDADHRAHSVLLMRAFAAQPGMAFVHSATANPHSAPVYRLFKFSPQADPCANLALRWVASDAALVPLALQRLGVGAGVAARAPWMKGAAAVVRWARTSCARATPPAAAGVPSAADVTQVQAGQWAHWGQDWDHWANSLSARTGLWLDRSAASLAWRLGDPDQADGLALLVLRGASGRLAGMCLVRDLSTSSQSTPKAELMDWVVLPDTPRAERAALLRAALGWATLRGLAVLEAKRYTGLAFSGLADLNPQRVALPPHANWALVRQARARAALATGASAWGMTGADGDDWFNTHRLEERPDRQAWAGAAEVPSTSEVEAGGGRSSVSVTLTR